MSDQSNKADELRLKRAKALKTREQERLRALHGPRLAAVIAKATERSLVVEDFDVNLEDSLHFDWPKDLAAASGLVVAYVGKDKAAKLLACFQEKLTSISGMIGFHEKSYLGFAKLEDVSPTSLLTASEMAEESVLFYVERPQGVILVDCYPSPPSEPFSVVVQGNDLASKLASCFIS